MVNLNILLVETGSCRVTYNDEARPEVDLARQLVAEEHILDPHESTRLSHANEEAYEDPSTVE